MQTYHRLGGSRPNQDLDVAMKQACSLEIWGQPNKQGGKFPAVKAYFGPLPSGSDGVEFETSLLPSSVQSRQGGGVSWCEAPHGPAQPMSSGFCSIQVKITGVRYRQVSQLPAHGVEWWP